MYLQLAENNYLSKRTRKPKNDRHPIKSVTLAPGRAFFLALLDYNVDGLAARLATEDLGALSRQWTKLGGDPNKLVKFINKGKRKSPHGANFLQKFTGPQALADSGSDENPSGLTADQKAKIIAASTALGVALGASIPATAPVAIPGGPILGSVIVGVMPFIKNAANKNKNQETTGANIPDAPEPPSIPDPNAQSDESFFQKYKTPILYGGGAVLLGGIYYLATHKKKRR